jgi:hypothetical protein
MENIGKKLLNAIDRAVSGPPKNIPALLYDWITEQQPDAAATKDELRALKDAQAKWQKAFDGTHKFTEGFAHQRFHAQLQNGKDHTDETVRTRGIESFVSENAGKLLVCKANMKEAGREAGTAINAIVARLAPVAKSILDARVQAELAEAQRFGLARVPSALTTALAEFANGLGQRHGENWHGKPSDMISFLTFN